MLKNSCFKIKKSLKVLLFVCFLPLLLSFKGIESYNPNNVSFEHLTMEDGLHSLVIYSIIQSRSGFLWFGGEGGLERYDGFKILAYASDPNDPRSIRSNNISSIYETDDGMILVGTWGGGLNVFHPEKGDFDVYLNDENNESSISGNRVQQVFQDSNGIIWAGTYKNGINRFDPETKKFYRYKTKMKAKRIWGITEDSFNRIWIATDAGVYYYDIKNDSFVPFNLQENVSSEFAETTVRSIYCDFLDYVWIGTEHGLYYYSINDGTSGTLTGEEDTEELFKKVPVNAIVRDRDTLWIGTYGEGLVSYDLEKHSYFRFLFQENRANWINHNDIRSLMIDRSDNLWIGTRGAGLNKLDLKPKSFQTFQHSDYNKFTLKHNKILYMSGLEDNRLFISTQEGVNVFTGEDNKFISYEEYLKNEKNIILSPELAEVFNQKISWYHTDSEGNHWFLAKEKGVYKISPDYLSVDFFNQENSPVGSLIYNCLAEDDRYIFIGADNGIYLYGKKDNQFLDTPLLKNSIIKSLVVSGDKSLWAGTEEGVYRFDFNFVMVNHYQTDPKNIQSLNSDIINLLFLDHNGDLWIATPNGLAFISMGTMKIVRMDLPQTLKSQFISSIIEDDSNNFWLSTKSGIIHYDRKNKVFNDYSGFVGVTKEYSPIPAILSGNSIFFGGLNGLTQFIPDKIMINNYEPQIQILSFKVNNEELVDYGIFDPSSLIIIPYRRRNFSVEFAAMDLTEVRANQYAYKLENFDGDWVYSGNRNYAEYKNLPGGRYILKIKGSNNQNYWNDRGTEVKIFVRTPPWQTIWAYFLYIIIITGTIGFIFWRKSILHHRELEKQKVLVEELRKIDKMKDEFLANTSHELKTPLNGIIGITESIKDYNSIKDDPFLQKNIYLILNSAMRLNNLVEDILDFSKIRDKGIILQRKSVELNTALESVIYSITMGRMKKDVKILDQVPKDGFFICADESRLEQILFNILGNAFKFTNTGSITINAEKQGDFAVIKISDTGIGIKEEDLSRIFTPFEQADGSISREFGGTGLGLTITKQLIELHGGKIKVESDYGKGTDVYLWIPLFIENCEDKEREVETSGFKVFKIQNENISPLKRLTIADEITKDLVEPEMPLSNLNKKDFTVLLADDDPVNLQVIKNFCDKAGYQSIQASNGEEVLNILKSEQKVDLVLLDIMMPKLSGYEVCMRIRERFTAYELPVIFLTAKTQVNDIIAGFNSGGNDYITKPIDINEFLARVRTALNLKIQIENNKNLADTIELKNQIINIISHDLRNPLSVIIASNDLLKMKSKESEDFAKIIKYIDSSANSINSILENFLQYAKVETGKISIRKEYHKLNLFIQTMMEKYLILAQRKNQKIIKTCSGFDEDYEVFIDVMIVSEILGNLISNAIKYSPYGTLIQFVVEKKDKRVFFRIKDEGPGLSDEDKNLMFRPFQKLSAKPTGGESSIGLGLSIVRKLAILHDGDIEVSSEPGKGSRFTFILTQL